MPQPLSSQHSALLWTSPYLQLLPQTVDIDAGDLNLSTVLWMINLWLQ